MGMNFRWTSTVFAEIGEFLVGYVGRRRFQEQLEKHPIALF
jgi:hypothetical protein